MSNDVTDGSYYFGKESGARKALTEAAEELEKNPDQVTTNGQVAQQLRARIPGKPRRES